MHSAIVRPPPSIAPDPGGRICGVCKRPLPDRTGKRGQPARYCPPRTGEDRSACSRLSDRASLLASTVREVLRAIVEEDGSTLEQPSVEARRSFQAVKGFLWAEANSATNRGRLVGAKVRAPYQKVRSGWWRNAPRKLVFLGSSNEKDAAGEADNATS